MSVDSDPEQAAVTDIDGDKELTVTVPLAVAEQLFTPVTVTLYVPDVVEVIEAVAAPVFHK